MTAMGGASEEPIWIVADAGAEWRCEWRGHRIAIRKIVKFNGFIGDECVLQHGSLAQARQRLIDELRRNYQEKAVT